MIKALTSFTKTKKGKILLLVFALGVGLLICSLFAESGTDASEDTEGVTLYEYKAELEEELAEFCSSVSGAGKCRVMVSFAEGESLEYKGSVLIGSTPPRVLGVTVLCEGADSAYVKSQISSMLSALFDIGMNRICVLKLSD